MQRLFFSKKHQLIEMINSYLQKASECVDIFLEAFQIYLKDQDCQVFQQLVDQINQVEAEADELRRRIEITLYEKALIPESRGDILGVLESVDKIPNKAQSVILQIDTECLFIPEQFKEDFLQLARINSQTMEDITQAVLAVFDNIKQVRKFTIEIGIKERASDTIERRLIRKVFQSAAPLGEKILLKELIIEMGNISDRAEDAGDRLTIIAAKRII
jgi:predicted phosphate transport protein (TIGR00153 family)